MNKQKIIHFFKSEEVFEKAGLIFNSEKKEIQKILKNADIQHVGSCSVPGAISKFDVDIQVRVEKESFGEALTFLSKKYQEKRPEIWGDGFAAFNTKKECSIDIVLTEIDSKYDDFYKVRDFLINNPEKLKEYNTLKMSFEGKLLSDYKKAKAEFLGGNGTVKFL